MELSAQDSYSLEVGQVAWKLWRVVQHSLQFKTGPGSRKGNRQNNRGLGEGDQTISSSSNISLHTEFLLQTHLWPSRPFALAQSSSTLFGQESYFLSLVLSLHRYQRSFESTDLIRPCFSCPETSCGSPWPLEEDDFWSRTRSWSSKCRIPYPCLALVCLTPCLQSSYIPIKYPSPSLLG